MPGRTHTDVEQAIATGLTGGAKPSIMAWEVAL